MDNINNYGNAEKRGSLSQEQIMTPYREVKTPFLKTMHFLTCMLHLLTYIILSQALICNNSTDLSCLLPKGDK
jgi:hypothetical protein